MPAPNVVPGRKRFVPRWNFSANRRPVPGTLPVVGEPIEAKPKKRSAKLTQFANSRREHGELIRMPAAHVRHWWADDLTLVVWLDIDVISPKIYALSSIVTHYRAMMRNAARTAAIYAFKRESMKFEPVKIRAVTRREVCQYMLDRVHTVGYTRYDPELFDSDSVVEAMHCYRDGSLDAFAGYSVSAKGNITWAGQYLDADVNRVYARRTVARNSYGFSYNQLEADKPALAITYMLRER